MAVIEPSRPCTAIQIVLLITWSFLVRISHPASILDEESATVPEAHGDPAEPRTPWADAHVPPPTPHLPTIRPEPGVAFKARSLNPYMTSVCALSACLCVNRSRDGKQVVDIGCNCGGSHEVLKISEDMLPDLADSLEIVDCDRVRLNGMSSGSETADDGGVLAPTGRGSRGRKKNRKNNLVLDARRKREANGEADGEESDSKEGEVDEGGVEWEEAVWEAELGPPDDDDNEEQEDPPEDDSEEEETFTTEGEESEKGGRYARSAPSPPDSKKPRSPHPLSSLRVRRVRELSMASHAVGPVRTVLLEDVKLIAKFPPYAFQPFPHALAPSPPAIHPSGYSQAESLPQWAQWEMESVTFKNVSDIETFSADALSNVLINSHFLWYRTNVVVMDMNAVKVMFRPMDDEDSFDPCETSYRAGSGEGSSPGNAPGEGEEEPGEVNASANGLPPDREREGSSSVGRSSSSGELKATCEAPRGSFTVAGSVISKWAMNAINVLGARSVVVDGCQIVRLSPSSISVGGTRSFSFTRNSVIETVSMYAFAVTASFVEFRRNRFERLEEGAMAGVKPMISKKSFGGLHVAFEDNLLIEVDLLSLNPGWDITTSSSVGVAHHTDWYSFRRNAFADCSCPHMGWIIQLAGERELPSSFYVHLLKDDSYNYCVREPVEPMGLILPCRLPLNGIRSLFEEDGITCKRHVDVVELCRMYPSAAPGSVYGYAFQILLILFIWTIYSFGLGHLLGMVP